MDSPRRSVVLLLPFAAALLLAACEAETTTVATPPADPERVPTMATRHVQTVISSNGQTRYRITSPLWLMYEEAAEPHWVFPEGVEAAELNDKYEPTTKICCDSAYYDEHTQVWDLNGNVRIDQPGGDVVLTNQLYWDQAAHELYSESFIHIEKDGRVIEGYGYRSNEKFTTYTLRRVEAIFPVSDDYKFH